MLLNSSPTIWHPQCWQAETVRDVRLVSAVRVMDLGSVLNKYSCDNKWMVRHARGSVTNSCEDETRPPTDMFGK